MMKQVVCLILFVVGSWADDISIHSISHAPSQAGNVLTVKFDPPPPDKAAAEDKNRWSASCFADENTAPTVLDVDSAQYEGGKTYDVDKTISLHFKKKDVASACKAVQLVFLGPKFPTHTWIKGSPDKPQSTSFFDRLFSPAKPSDTPDYSISFSWAPAVGSGPVYSLDGSIRHTIAGLNPSFAFLATAKSDSSKKADPDSFTWALSLLKGPGSRFHVGWRSNLTGMEFDKQGNVMNEISQASLMWTKNHVSRNSDHTVLYSWSMILDVGVELGTNLKNKFTIAGDPGQRGTGFIFRGVPAVQFAFVVPTSNPKHAIKFNSNYTVRLPARGELFLETRHVTDPVPELGTNPRHYVENNLSFNLTEFFALKIQHSYGALPPAYKFTDHKGSVGIEFTAKQPR
jgi:hypothetical protein